MIREKVGFLIDITDKEWGQYAFSRDPLNGKVSNKLRQEMIEKANECGRQEAIKLRKKYRNISVEKLAENMNLEIIEKDSYGTDAYIMFACYNSPNKVTLFKKNLQLNEQFMKENELENMLNYIDVKNVLLAHEMFHHIEEFSKDIYTKVTKIVLWKLGSFKYKSTLVALGEIAAMAFAKELLSLPYNPYIFDILMLYPHDENKADKLFNEIKEFKGGLANE